MLTMRRWAVAASIVLVAALVTLTATITAPPSTGRGTPPRPAAGVAQLDELFGESEQPNIVVIMADDMRDDDLQYMPNAQRLIRERGVRFTNTFAPQPLCCPARASFMTGMYSHNHEVWTHSPPWGFRSFDDDETLPVWLNEVGYNTVFLGKYLNGYGIQKLPNGRPSMNYVPPGWTDWRASIDGGGGGIDEKYLGSTYSYFDTTLNVNGVLEPHHGEYQTRLLGAESDEAIRAYSRSPRPFFMWASYMAPHVGLPHEDDDPQDVHRDDGAPFEAKSAARPADVEGMFDDTIQEAPGAEGEADVSGKPYFIRKLPQLNEEERAALTEITRQRAEALAVLDQEIADTISVLEETGELDNTIVMVTSDNGYLLGEHRKRQGKILLYEPSLRIPLIMRGPGIPAGETRTDPFTMIDFAPTLLQAAGAQDNHPMDGISLLDVARNGDRGWTRAILAETGPRRIKDRVARSVNLLDNPDGPSQRRFSQGVRTARYLYVEHASRERELYDLRTDPGQLTNVVDEPGRHDIVRQLARILDDLRDCEGKACTTPLPRSLRSP